ncbi:MAG: LysE family transporter [Methanospirillaceae archaeon]|nr:LysE family transporter [Methanospirillaceae archaeon]
MEYQIAEIFVLSFCIGLTGCLTPGPTLIATIQTSLVHGWRAGPLVTVGHILVESVLAILIIFGFSYLLSDYTGYISMIGGVALILFGIITLRSSPSPISRHSDQKKRSGPVCAGCITAVSNPYFWLWWITIGAAFLLDSLAGGVLLVIAFMTGHWLADFGCFTTISCSMARGRGGFKDRGYRVLLTICGGFLIACGIWFFLIGGDLI